MDRIKQLVEEFGIEIINKRDDNLISLLHWAAINNRKEIIKYFIENGVEVDAVGGELNATPLHWATRQGHLDSVILLMKAGADTYFMDAEGVACIHLAAQLKHTSIVAYFIANGVSADLRDRGGDFFFGFLILDKKTYLITILKV